MINTSGRIEHRDNNPAEYIGKKQGTGYGRLGAYMRGWTNWIDDGKLEERFLHWETVGALYALELGKGSRDAAEKFPVEKRRELYLEALEVFLTGDHCAHWSDGQRDAARQFAKIQVQGLNRKGSIRAGSSSD